jgi:hypothetical protein
MVEMRVLRSEVVRETAAMLEPAEAKARAVARPMPREAPVMRLVMGVVSGEFV